MQSGYDAKISKTNGEKEKLATVRSNGTKTTATAIKSGLLSGNLNPCFATLYATIPARTFPITLKTAAVKIKLVRFSSYGEATNYRNFFNSGEYLSSLSFEGNKCKHKFK